MKPALFMSQTGEWYTPKWVIDKVSRLLDGIDLDPASNAVAQEIVQARHWCGFDHPDPAMRDGLAIDWSPYRSIYVNPPYGRAIVPFVQKIAMYAQDKQMAVLVAARTDTKWLRMLMQHDHAAVFFRNRISFWTLREDIAQRSTFPSVLLCYHCDLDRIRDLFSDQLIYRPV
jgi:hypothetical protein